MPCLVLQVRDQLERFELSDGDILGRGDDAHVRIVDPTISRHHARFELTDPALPSVVDLNSANGIRVDGDRVYPKDVLPDGAQVRFGDVAGWFFQKEPPFKLDTGPMCAVCQWKVEPRQALHRCNDCGVLYHRDCWVQNGGCGSYGCTQVGAAVIEDSGDHAGDDSGLEVAVAKTTTSADAALLASAVAGSALGILAFGIPAAIVAAIAGVKKSIPAAALAGAGALVGVGVSWWWWLASPI
ncbi:MAG: FHA domain-containing protein [Planctomycetota bacterium]